MYACMSVVLLKPAQNTKGGWNGRPVLDDERDQRQVEGKRRGPSKLTNTGV